MIFRLLFKRYALPDAAGTKPRKSWDRWQACGYLPLNQGRILSTKPRNSWDFEGFDQTCCVVRTPQDAGNFGVSCCIRNSRNRGENMVSCRTELPGKYFVPRDFRLALFYILAFIS